MGLLKAALGGRNFVGAESFATWQPDRSFFGHFSSDAYSSAYPSIRAIANEYMAVRPYAIDANGKTVQHPVVNALYHPNQQDSSVAFAEKIAVSTLAHRKTYLLVWRKDGKVARPGGDFRHDTIAGFTFLEFPGITRRNGKTVYNIGAQYFDEDEVLVLPGGVDANDLYAGYSPTEASRRWATLDDYIADFQAGFFENGAVPSGQFLITAGSTKDYDNMVDIMQSRHRGARNNNNVSYAHRPIDPTTNKPAQAQIEWVPFSQTNKEIDFKNLFEQTNKRIDLAYGVPQIVKGVDDAATYANAQVAEKGFAKRAVYPLLLRNYTQLTHELNRITNGLGVALTFEYDIPTVSDEEKVDAERKQIEAQTITSMLDAGYSLESIVNAFEFSNAYKLLKKGNDKATIVNDKPDVDEGGEVNDSPDPSEIDGVTPANGEAKRKNPKVSNEIGDNDRTLYENQISDVVRKHMQSQIDDAIEEARKQNGASNAAEEDTEDEDDEFRDDMLAVIVALLIAQGAIEYSAGEKLLIDAGVSTENLTAFVLNAEVQDTYREYLAKVATSYSGDTAASIRSVLAESASKGWSQSELEQNLQGIMQTDEWRVKRLATSEINRAQSLSGVEAMKQIQGEAAVPIEKSLKHTGGGDKPCEFCAVLIDRWVPVDEIFVDKNEIVVGENGGIYVNDFSENDGFDIHPNGHCSSKFRVATGALSASNSLHRHYVDDDGSMTDFDLRCDDCGRYLNLKEISTIIGRVRCPSAKCKVLNFVKVVRSSSSEADIRFSFATS